MHFTLFSDDHHVNTQTSEALAPLNIQSSTNNTCAVDINVNWLIWGSIVEPQQFRYHKLSDRWNELHEYKRASR